MSARDARECFVQAAGHKDTIKLDDEDTSYIMKPYDEQEVKNYEAIWDAKNEPLQQYVARFGGVIEVKLASGDSTSSAKFVRLSNLLQAIEDVMIMDIKMGCRSFIEGEESNTKPRKDLYEKLKKFAPGKITDEERAAEAITKYKWMTVNDELKTTNKFGFRVDGVTSRDGDRATPKELLAIQTLDDVLPMFVRLLPRGASGDGSSKRRMVAVARQVLSHLELMHVSLESSPFFRKSSFVGSSLLFLGHRYGASVYIIDFAKTQAVPEGINIDHRSAWTMGNYEDGFLLGLETMIACWTRVLTELENDLGQPGIPSLLSSQYDSQLTELEKKLRSHAIDTSLLGTGSAKSLQELHYDLYIAKVATLEVKNETLYRIAEVVRAWIITDINGESVALMGAYRKTKADGEVSYLYRPFAKKISLDESWKTALQRSLTARFGLSQEAVNSYFDIKSETYKLNVEEMTGSVEYRGGYPGLTSLYRTHEVDVWVQRTASPELAAIGLPTGDKFITVRNNGYMGHSLLSWEWLPRDVGETATWTKTMPA